VKIHEIGEFGLIAGIKNSGFGSSLQVIQGRRDSTAASSLGPGNDLVSTVELLVEDVLFHLSSIDPYPLGWKAATLLPLPTVCSSASPSWAKREKRPWSLVMEPSPKGAC
jgi:hypothetical protein